MPYKDILSAEEYGDLKSVVEPGFQLLLSPDPITDKIKKVLKDENYKFTFEDIVVKK